MSEEARGFVVRRMPVGLAMAVCLIASFAFPVGIAQAANPELLFRAPEGAITPSPGEGAGELNNPRAVASDPNKPAHIFVVESNNSRISEFTAWGVFVKAWGWGVADGSPELQTCGPGASPPTVTCQSGIAGDGAGQIRAPRGITVDDQGGIYIFESSISGTPSRRVQKFDLDGDFVWMVGGDVNQGPNNPGDICTAADVTAGDTCGAGVPGVGPREFSNGGVGNYIAFDPTLDSIRVGDQDRIQELGFDGSFKSELSLPGETVNSLAVAPNGTFYAIFEGEDDVRKFDSAGIQIGTLDTVDAQTLATDVNNGVYVVDFAHLGVLMEDEVVRFNAAGVCTICQGDEFALPPPQALETVFPIRLLGLGTNLVGDVYVTAFKGLSPPRSYFTAYGPLPTAIEPAPAREPIIGSQFAAAVGTTTATLKAEINPRFYASTTYQVEYGPEDCETSSCTSTAPAPLGAERNAFATTNGVVLPGLEPSTTYHYRFVATSGSFVVEGPDRTFRTRASGAVALPDGRGYEQVSPTVKNSAEVGVPSNPGGLIDRSFSTKPQQAAPSGQAVAFASFPAFGENPQSAPGASEYVARRTSSGWTTANITPPDSEGIGRDPIRAFSPGLDLAAMVLREPPLTPEASAGYENLYLRSESGGALQTVTNLTPQITGIKQFEYCVNYAGASSDGKRVILTASGAFPGTGAPVKNGQSLYEWTAAGGLQLASVLPNGSPATPTDATAFGASGARCIMGDNVVRNAISADGTKLFWTSGGKLYARLNGTDTIQLDLTQGGSGPSGGGQFWAASDDGSKVIFSAAGKLTPDANGDDLYLYDFSASPGSRLTALTANPAPAGVEGVLGASDNGTVVYFAASADLGGAALAGEPNVYRWQQGVGIQFVATLEAPDFSNWDDRPSKQTARVSADGSHLVFLSIAPLTGYDNLDQQTGEPDSQVYLYDAAGDDLICVSCNPSEQRPIGPSTVPTWSTPFEQQRYLSDDGRRVFFETVDALDLHDTNGKRDVYEFERTGSGSCTTASSTYVDASDGCLYLISSGTSSDESFLIDASSKGDDIFISTRQPLVLQDEDQRYDIYDARVGGGFKAPEPPPVPCVGEACRPQQLQPTFIPPPTSSYGGSGNVTEPKKPVKCKKGTHKVKKKGKVRCVKNKKKAKGAKKRRAAGRRASR